MENKLSRELKEQYEEVLSKVATGFICVGVLLVALLAVLKLT